MDLKMRIETTLPKFRRHWGDLVDRQVPFAHAQALNAQGFEIRNELKALIPIHMDAPIAFTRNAPMVRKASKRDLVMVVFLRDEASKGSSPLKYLEKTVDGGQRKDKRSETLLKNRGLLASSSQTVIARSLRDAHGNLKGGGGHYTRMLSQLQAQHDAYQNETAKSRKRGEGKGNTSRYFVGRPGGGKLPLGVYQRQGRGSRDIKPVLLFGEKRTYKKRFPFYAITEGIFRDRFMLHFEAQLERAIRSAR